MSYSIELTQAAITKVREILFDVKEDNKIYYLRVGVRGGGCSGFSYEFDLCLEKCEDDHEILIKDDDENQIAFSVIIDPFSGLYLQGAQVDFQENEMGCKFMVNNPNAKTTCGCGESFDA